MSVRNAVDLVRHRNHAPRCNIYYRAALHCHLGIGEGSLGTRLALKTVNTVKSNRMCTVFHPTARSMQGDKLSRRHGMKQGENSA